MDQKREDNDPSGPPEADVVTQIQDHIALLCSRFFNFIGALQRDAPPVALHAEPTPDQKQEELEVRVLARISLFCFSRCLLTVLSVHLLQKQIGVMREEVTSSLTTLESLIQRLPDLGKEPEDRQWDEAAKLEAEAKEQSELLKIELAAAQKAMNSLYRAHGELADVALEP